MLRTIAVLAAVLAMCAAQAAPPTIAPTGTPGAYNGFSISLDKQPVAQIQLQVGGKWTARKFDQRIEAGRAIVELREFDTSGTGGTPTLGPGSFVRLSAAAGDAYPELSFRFEINAFDVAAWERSAGQKAPLSFLALPLDDARLWYVHGLLCPTPRWDPYPLTRPTIGGSWAEGWSYGVALGALTVPAMALWDDQSGKMVGYEWAGTRLTDKSCKDVGIAYCEGTPGWSHQCLTLLANAMAHWTDLTYPQTPLVVQSHLRVLYNTNMPATADPNRFILQRIYADHHKVLPAAPAMNDLSWMVARRLDELGGVGASNGSFIGTLPKKGWGFEFFFYDAGTKTYYGGYRPVDLMYKEHKTEAIARFDKDLAEFLGQAKWEDIGGDHCCYWRFPLEGSWMARMGGEPADTVHNVQQFGVGASMLACYANTHRADLLPYLDGMFNWSRHCIYTRGEIADIPESMFTLQATTLAMEFLMNYHLVFGQDADAARRARAKEAFDLAYTVVYRNANVTIGDSDERDNLTGQFMMPGNMAKPWLGIVGPAELCLPFRSMIMMHVETGDPVFKWLVRGALDRWWIGFKEDCWHTAENIDIWGVQEGKKGAQTGIHDPCDAFWEWAEPVGDATMRVTCGAKAAMAFCKGTRALDVDQYAFAPPTGFKFHIARVGDGPVPDRFSIIVSSPYRDLAGLAVRVDGKAVPADQVRVLGTYHEHLYIPGVRAGSVVEVGDTRNAVPQTLPTVPAARGFAMPPAEELQMAGRRFAVTDLTAAARVSLADTWTSPDTWGGLPVGTAYAEGVPYSVGPRAVGPGGQVAVAGQEAFLLGVSDRPGALTVNKGDWKTEFGPQDGLLAAQGWPLCRWKLNLYSVKLPPGGATVKVSQGGLLLGVTTLQTGPGLADELRKKAVPATEQALSWAPVLAEAQKRLEAAGAAQKTPIAFIPPYGSTYPFLSEWAERLGLAPITLSPNDMVTPGLLDPKRLPVIIYTGNEEFLKTVITPGDAQEALMQYLRQGGFMVVAGICHPFTYAKDLTVPDDEVAAGPRTWELINKQFELFLMGPGEKTGDAIGFEQPPAGAKLTMRLNDKQPALWDFPATLPFPEAGDLRYRPLSGEGLAKEDEFVPILTTQDAAGQSYGPAAALIRHRCAAFKNLQVLWAWGTLLQKPFEQRDQLAAELLTYAATAARPATEPLPDRLSLALPEAKFRVAVLPPDTNSRDDLVKRACATNGATPVFLTPDQFVTASHFNATNYPVAVQALGGERWICGYRGDHDGEDTYKRYLKQGGTLVVCQPATPFWYELTWRGNDWKQTEPRRFWSMAFDLGFETQGGWEKPDEPVSLELTAEGQKLWPDLPARFVLDYMHDQRWRPFTAYRSSAAREFIPLAYLTKSDGTRFPGVAAAMIRFRDSEYKGARIICVWGNAVEGPMGEKILTGCLKEAMTPSKP